MSLEATYNISDPFINPGTKLYLLYSGQNFYFTGKQKLNLWFTSLELPFGGFYKTQIAPFFTTKPYSNWPWSDIKRDFFFTFAEPYYQDTFPDFGTKKVRIFFKYTNDNNPF